jgi:hypothetical protein
MGHPVIQTIIVTNGNEAIIFTVEHIGASNTSERTSLGDSLCKHFI